MEGLADAEDDVAVRVEDLIGTTPPALDVTVGAESGDDPSRSRRASPAIGR
jgi:hypothetical protein